MRAIPDTQLVILPLRHLPNVGMLAENEETLVGTPNAFVQSRGPPPDRTADGGPSGRFSMRTKRIEQAADVRRPQLDRAAVLRCLAGYRTQHGYAQSGS